MKPVCAIVMAALLAAVILGGCSGGSQTGVTTAAAPEVSPATATPAASYVPLKVGNKWVFNGWESDSAPGAKLLALGGPFFAPRTGGRVVATSTYTYNEQVMSSSVFSGVTWFRIRESDPYDTVYLWARHDATGFAVRDAAPGKPGATRYYLKAPIVVGTQWHADGGTMRITSTTATVQVPRGRFTNCVTVQCKYSSGENVVRFYHSAIGPIQLKDISGGVAMGRLDLKSYTLK